MPHNPSALLSQLHLRKQSSLGIRILLLGQIIVVSLFTMALQPVLQAQHNTEDTKFNDPAASSFASDVAVSGDFALVGASGANGAGNNLTGAVYSYQKMGGEWVFDEKFFASDGEDDDSFGASVALVGDVAIIGAPNDDDPANGSNSGSAYLFRHDGTNWVLEQKITASDATSDWSFGGAVAISETVAVIGFPKQTGSPGGAAYVFRYNGSTWVEEKILTASDANAGDDFGAAVSVIDDVVVVGASAKSGGGAAYVYRNTVGSTWVEERILTASDGMNGDEFGSAVAVSESLAIIGAASVNGQIGAAYIFRNTEGSIWDETRISRGNPAGPAGSFGESVAISGEVALVGAWAAQGNRGTGHLFRFDGSEWLETVLVPEDPTTNFGFGNDVSLSGDHAMLGAAFDGGFGNNGAAYIYNLVPEITWDNPEAITYGTALSDTQLNATAGSLPGTFSYLPASGTVLDAGTYTLTVNFTPTDTARYANASATVSITVNKATATIDWNDPTPITYGTPLSVTQLNATSSAPGTITYSHAEGTVLETGNGHLLTATLPASSNHEAATKKVTINVTPAPLVITADDKQRSAGVANPMLTASYSGFVNGDTALATPPTLSTTATTDSLPGVYPITVTGGSDGNYMITRVNGILTVAEKEIPVLTWSNPAAIVYGTALGSLQLNASSAVEGSFSYSPDSGTVLDAGTHTLMVNFMPTDTARYAFTSKTVPITVNLAPLTITADSQQRKAGEANPTLTASFAGFVNGDTVASLDTPVRLSTTAMTQSDPGDYPITASGAADANYAIIFTPGILTITAVDDFLPGSKAKVFGAATVGVPALGEIETVGDEDWFAVSLEAGREYLVQVIATVADDGRVIDPALAGIYDSNRTFLGYGNDDRSDVVENSESLFTPSQTGTYYVAAMGPPEGKDLGSLTDTGAYSVEVYDQGPVDIAALTQSFISTNTVNEGEDLTLLVNTIVPREVNLSIETMGPLNEYIAARDLTVDLTGSVAAEGSDFTFLYEFGATQSLRLDALDDELVEDDETVTAHIFGYIDWIIPAEFGGTEIDNLAGSTVMGNIGRRYIDLRVNVTINSAPEGNPNPVLDFTFVNPEIVTNVLTNFEDGSGEFFAVIPVTFSGGAVEGEVLANGDLLINASSGTSGQSVIVAFVVEDTRGAMTRSEQEIIFGAHADDYLPGDTATIFGSIDVDVPTTGNIELEGDRDRFEATLQAGVQYSISLEGVETSGGSLIDPAIYGVFNGQGQFVSGGADNNSGVGNNALVERLMVDTDGIYQIEVGTERDIGVGDYTLTVEFLDYIDDFLPGISGGFGSVTVGGRTTGEIETSGDVDSFEVSLQSNTTYAISILGRNSNNGTLVNPNLLGIFSASDLLTPVSSVQTLETQSVGDDSISYFSPHNPGEYFIGVKDLFDGVGTYTVAVDNIGVRDDYSADVTTTGSIAPGGSAAGRIDFAEDKDWFEVSLAANRRYEIKLVPEPGGNALADPFFSGVYDEDGDRIEGTDNDDGGDDKSSALQFATDDVGTFYLAAGGFDSSTGQYRLELNDLGLLDDDKFDITIQFSSDDVPKSYTNAVEEAVERWEEIIVGDLPYAFIEGHGIVDDILIEVAVGDVDLSFPSVEQDILAISSVLDQRSEADAGAGALPTYSRIVINPEEIGELLNLDEFVMHTIGRALGFGSLWEEFGLVRDTDGVATYTGSNALREMSELWGDRNGGIVMLEDGADGALANEYWREGLFVSELMTSRVGLRRFVPNTSGNPDNPISRLTIAAMQDLGYGVDFEAADRYFFPPTKVWIERGSGQQLRIDFSSANQSNSVGDIKSGEGREGLRDIVINTFTGDTITFTGEALVADDDDDEVVTVTLSVNGQPLIVAVPLGAGVDTTSPVSMAAAVAVALAANPSLQAIASSGVVSVAGEGSNTVGIETVVFAPGVNDGGATATLAAARGESVDLNVGTIFFEDDGSSGVDAGARLEINGGNDVTFKSLDTSDADITSLTVDLTHHVGTLTATGGSPAFDGGDGTVLLEILNDNDEAESGGVDLKDGVAQYGSVITFDDPNTSGEGENEFGIEYIVGHGETYPFAGVSSMVLEDIDATMHDGVISLGVISEINSEEFDLKAGETGQVFGCLGTALDDGVEETPTLSASGTWTFNGSPGGYTPAGGLNNLDLEIKNIDIKPGGHLTFIHTDICIIGNIDLSEAVLDLDAGSTIKVSAGGKLTLTVEQVNELQGVLQGIPINVVGPGPGYDGWAVEQGLAENAGFSDDASGDGLANSFHYAMKIPAMVVVQTEYPDLVPTIDQDFFDDKATLFFQIPDNFREDVILEVEESTDLQSWKVIALKEGKTDWLFQVPNLVISESLENGYRSVGVTASGPYTEQGHGFYRLSVRLR